MRHLYPALLTALTVSAACASGTLPPAQTEEAVALRRWVAAHLEGAPITAPPSPGIEILAAHDLLQKNHHRGQPLRVGARIFRRGLYAHAPTRLRVRLPGPARSFRASVGVDANPETRVGHSSIVFIVRTGGRALLRTGVMRVDTPAQAISVDLAGASELELELSDAGDGIDSDQGVWGDAQFTLSDGRILMLDELPTPDGFAAANGPEPPFSFTCGGKPSAELLSRWQVRRTSRTLDAVRTERTATWTDPASGLEVRCTSVEYADYPVIEWTVWLRNTGSGASPLIEDLQGADLAFSRHPLLPTYEFVLHHNNGTLVTTRSVPDGRGDFGPLDTRLEASSDLRFVPPQGRPTAGEWPYYNLESMGKGTILAVGWPGRWAADFARDGGAALRVRCGQERTRFRLRPGEEVRTPLMVLLFWSGDRDRAQNTWRRWMLAHNVPRPGGKPLEPMSGGFDGYYFPNLQITQAGEEAFIDRYAAEKLLPDVWWVDAGWYPCRGSWVNTGTWEVDRSRFAGGLGAVVRRAHEKGIGKSILWMEPERVTPGSWLYQNRPQWLLGRDGETKLLDLGNPEARVWAVERVGAILHDEGIDYYRQDFNMDPLPCWQAADGPDRVGLTENRYVQGYLAFWDELLRRNPSLLIDTCASGAHRDDLETLRRSVPLWRSDFAWDPTGMQCQTYGLSAWVPYYGTGTVDGDAYTVRSDMTPFFLMSWDMRRKDLDYGLLRRLATEWRAIAPCMLGDYWPLTEYSLSDTAWIAWQFDRPDLGEGVVQAFRRAQSPYETARFRLRGLDAGARYTVRDLDRGLLRTMSGRELMEAGMRVGITDRPGSAVIRYRRVAGR